MFDFLPRPNVQKRRLRAAQAKLDTFATKAAADAAERKWQVERLRYYLEI